MTISFRKIALMCRKMAFVGVLASTQIAGMVMQGEAQSTGSYWQEVQKRGVLKCGAAIASPYVMRDPQSGHYSGFFVELCRQFADVLQVKAEFVDTTWDNLVAGLQASKWDMAMALNRTPLRAMAAQFTIPAVQYQVSFVYNKANTKIPEHPVKLEDIDKPGITVAVMSGTAWDKALTATLKNATLMRLTGGDEARLSVMSRRADILADASDSNKLFKQANASWAVEFIPEPALAKQGISFALSRELSPADVAVVDIFLEGKVADGEVDRLVEEATAQSLENVGK